MGYFPNGTAGDLYEAEYCEKCVHYGEEGTECCPVYFLHLLWNYEQHSDDIKKEALDTLIPMDEQGFNEQCKMFYQVV